MKDNEYNFQTTVNDIETKRHKSASTPSYPLEDILHLKDVSDNATDFTNSNTSEPVFNLKTNSLFAYQEFDKFSSLCDDNSNKLNGDFSNESERDSKIDDNFDENLNSEEDKKNKNTKRNSAMNAVPAIFYKNWFPSQNKQIARFSQNNIKIDQNQLLQGYFKGIYYPILIDKKVQQKNDDFQINNNSQKNIYINTEKNFDKSEKNLCGVRRRSKPIMQIGFPGFQNFNMAINNNDYNNGNFYYNNNVFPNFMCNNQTYIDNLNKNLNIKNTNNVNKNDYIEHSQKKRNSQMLPFNKLTLNNYMSISESSKDEENSHKTLNYYQKKINCKQMEENLELNKNNKAYLVNFYQEIKNYLVDIIVHQYGNYLMQKFFEILLFQENIQIFSEIFTLISPKLYEISIDNYGTRVFQKVLEILQEINYNYYTFEFMSVIKNLINTHLYELCCDKNGNHVFQKILKIVPRKKNEFLYSKLTEIVIDISLLQQGVTILQTSFECATLEQKDKICNKIIDNISKLINDKYGNYTVQTIVLLNEDNLNMRIFKYISENILELSKQKFSSNVIDKFIINNNNYSMKLIIDIINKNLIKELIFDKYGNYVIQKAMTISENDKGTFDNITKQIKPLLNDLKNNKIGKKIYEKIMKIYGDLISKC